ncbi:ABC transporter permease [Rhodococcus rhodochrous]|uniref:ABC transporter permease n=1 Tax=Rhodococcus rhodochrous TaxID=1829 RepID=UPI003B969ADB
MGLQGYAALEQLGSSVLTGFLSAYVNTRELAPIVAALALSATVGCASRHSSRHEDQRGDRRPRGDGRAVAAFL